VENTAFAMEWKTGVAEIAVTSTSMAITI